MKRLIKSLLGLNAVSLVHVVSGKPYAFGCACLSGFAAARHPKRSLNEIPEISLGEVLGDRRPRIELSVMRYEDGILPSDQAMVLLSLLVAEAPREVLEIGTYMGHTTRLMAENLEDATIHTVDLPEAYETSNESSLSHPKDDFHLIQSRRVGREFRGQSCEGRIKQHFADTAKWDFREAGRPTFFFIDGSHTYEYCKNDSDKCYDLCSGKGVFLWHDCDYVHPGVEKLVLNWRRMGRDVRRIAGTPLAYWKSS